MAIATLNDYIVSQKSRVQWTKVTAQTVVAGIPFTNFGGVGSPAAGTWAGTTTASAILQTTALTGYMSFGFSSGTTYLSKLEFSNTVSSRLRLVDIITKSGPYSYATGTTAITSYPSITARCPDYYASTATVYGTRNEIWIGVTTAFVTGTAWQVQCTYTNQAGATSHTTIISAAQAAAALTLNKLFQLPLQSGDTGVQAIQSVIVTNGGTIMTAGAFNVMIVREIWTSGRIPVAYAGDIHDMLKTGLPIIYNDSALDLWCQADSTSFGLPEIYMELCNNG
jgi:hypothetical protein